MRVVIDGNQAAAYCAYAFSEAAVLYPITPSSTMSEFVEEWSSNGKNNIFQEPLAIETMQSEKGVAGFMHGLLRAGTCATSFTSSQGLLLMVPTLYKLVGELLPGVVHVAARAVSTNALSIFGDHSDVMAARQTGAIMISSGNVQEVAVFSAVAHCLSLATSLPAIHFFDGFDTSHEVRDIQLPSYEQLRTLLPVEAYQNFKENAMRNDHPKNYGTAQSPEIFFQQQETSNPNYLAVAPTMAKLLADANPLFKTACQLVNYYGDPQAQTVMIVMGSVGEVAKQVVENQNKQGQYFGLIVIHLYRPFPEREFLANLPKTVENLVVLDRTREFGATAEPLLADVRNCCYDLPRRLKIIGGRFGLGSKNTTPDQLTAAFFEVLKTRSKSRFTIGIQDDQTNFSLDSVGERDLTPNDTFEIKTWGRGSDGAVSCNRQTAEIIGENKDCHVQAKFWYDARKTNNTTVSELRISAERQPIHSSYRLQKADIVNCYHESFLQTYDLVHDLKENGSLLINTNRDKKALLAFLSGQIVQQIVEKHIQVYTIPADILARKYELGPHINTLMQTALFKIFPLLPFEKMQKYLNAKVAVNYEENQQQKIALLSAQAEIPLLMRKIKFTAKDTVTEKVEMIQKNKSAFQVTVQDPLLQYGGNGITVQQLVDVGMNAGASPQGLTKVEKRGLTESIPIWKKDNCSQCNLCSTVCPHAAIRPFLLNEELANELTIPSKEIPGKNYRLQVSPLDCTGCQACVDVCSRQALKMEPVVGHSTESDRWQAMLAVSQPEVRLLKNNSRTSQYQQPLLEFSGACAGCGETAYVKLLTQLFGSQLTIANATGCSSIWGGAFPSIPYTPNQFGEGVAWGSSLLENNAEYGAGISASYAYQTKKLVKKINRLKNNTQLSTYLRQLLAAFSPQTVKSPFQLNMLKLALLNEKEIVPEWQEISTLLQFLNNKVTWIMGGDGWANDIDSDGIDYLVTQNKNINLLVLDNGSYANTGGQYTSSTPLGAKVKFKSNGNELNRKDLAYQLMQRENVYVAQVCLGSNPEQTITAFNEAVEFDGPAVVIAYSPCLLQGIRHNSYLLEQKKAVSSGCWPIFRYHPEKKQVFRLESPKPEFSKVCEYYEGEKRFNHGLNGTKRKEIFGQVRQKYNRLQDFRDFQDFKAKNARNRS